VIGDECHAFKAKCVRGLMDHLTVCPNRVGLTGTLDDVECNEMILTGLFGKQARVATTAELMDQGLAAALNIQVMLLSHPHMDAMSYDDEVHYLMACQPRNELIVDTAAGLTGNVLILFRHISHGKQLHDLVRQRFPDRPAYFIHGGVNVNDRDAVRQIIEQEDGAIITASYGTFSTGINIRRLHGLVMASPLKSKIALLQSIGRILRLAEGKTICTAVDVGDDLHYPKRRYALKNNHNPKDKHNHTLRHLAARLKEYQKEKFSYNIIPINICQS
jgi:superfamily II DNA or RNA helicase